MDIPNTILTSGVIATVITGIVAIINNNKQAKMAYITGERAKWRKKMKKISSQVYSATEKEKLCEVLAELKLQINGYRQDVWFQTVKEIKNKSEKKNVKAKSVHLVEDGKIWEAIAKIESTDDQEQIKKEKTFLLAYIGCLLKYDWERSKNEVITGPHIIICVILAVASVGLWCAAFTKSDSRLTVVCIATITLIVFIATLLAFLPYFLHMNCLVGYWIHFTGSVIFAGFSAFFAGKLILGMNQEARSLYTAFVIIYFCLTFFANIYAVKQRKNIRRLQKTIERIDRYYQVEESKNQI